MKRLAAIMICAVCAFIPLKAYAADVPETGAQAYVLYCPDNGEILVSKNENERMKPASTTKLMTTLITLESDAKGNDIITFTKDMTAEGSSMYLKLGEQVTLINPAYETAKELEKMLAASGLANGRPVDKNEPYPYKFFVSDDAKKFKDFANSILPIDVTNARIVPIEEY